MPPLCPRAPQECVRLHTINRATGRARIWEVGLTFSSQLTANAFDTDGAYNLTTPALCAFSFYSTAMADQSPSPSLAPRTFSPVCRQTDGSLWTCRYPTTPK